MQVYSGNFLDGSVVGRGGVAYGKHAALCLETQSFPDAINHPEWKKEHGFPDGVLWPGEKYRHVAMHVFHTDAADAAGE